MTRKRPGEPYPADIVDTVTDLYSNRGLTVREVAEKLARSTAYVRCVMTQHRIPSRSHGPRPGHGHHPTPQFTAASRAINAARAKASAATMIRRVTGALAVLGDAVTAEHAQAARLRIDHPDESMAQLAARAGITRNAYVGRLVRLLELAAPPAPVDEWVAKTSGPPAKFWQGPETGDGTTWTTDRAAAARFESADAVRSVLTAVYGDRARVPAGCTLARLT